MGTLDITFVTCSTPCHIAQIKYRTSQ